MLESLPFWGPLLAILEGPPTKNDHMGTGEAIWEGDVGKASRNEASGKYGSPK